MLDRVKWITIEIRTVNKIKVSDFACPYDNNLDVLYRSLINYFALQDQARGSELI